MKNSIQKYTIIIGLLILLTGAYSCKKDPIDWYAPIGPPMTSYVKYINAIPGSVLDFYVYYTEMVDTVKYATDQPYTNSPYGGPTVFATNNNQTTNRITANTGAATPQMNGQGFVAEYYQTMIACKNTDSTNAETMILLRDNLQIPAEGTAHIRFVYLTQRGASKITAVDLKSAAGPNGMADIFLNQKYRIPSNSVLIDPSKGLNTPNLGVYTSGPFTPLAAGEYSMIIQSSGGGDTVATKSAVLLESGKIYTVYSTGKIGDAVAAPLINLLKHN